MWEISAIAMVVILIAAWQAERFGSKRAALRTRKYRQRYRELCADLGSIVSQYNFLALFLPRLKDGNALERFEIGLHDLELLVCSVRQLNPFGKELSQFEGATVLLSSCRLRLKESKADFSEQFGNSVLTALERAPKQDKACYFCSKPFEKPGHDLVRVQVEKSSRKVWGCEACRQALKTHGKIKVLFLQISGKSHHWSKVEGFVTQEKYWSINEDSGSTVEPERRSLKLVWSRHDDEAKTE